MGIDDDTKQEIIAKIKELDQPKKLKCMALYENLLKSYNNESNFSSKTRELYYNNNIKTLDLLKDMNLILEGNEEAVNKYISNANDFFTEEELNSEELKKPLENIKENFYYNSMKKCIFMSEFIKTDDEPILKTLDEIYHYNTKENDNVKIIFKFKNNEFFTNKEISVELISDPNNAAEIIEIKSDVINWKENKDPRYFTEKTKRNKKKKELRESFFNYFCNIKEVEITEEEDDSADILSERSLFMDSIEIFNMVMKEIINYCIPSSYFKIKVPAFEENYDMNEPIVEENEENTDNIEQKPECNNQ